MLGHSPNLHKVDRNVEYDIDPLTGRITNEVAGEPVKFDTTTLGLAQVLELTPSPKIAVGATLAAAITAGVCKVVVVGDSVSAGSDLIYPNSYANALQQYLTLMIPTCKFEVVNYSIGSRYSGQLASNTYKAPADFNIAASLGHALDNQYWPSGSVDGKFWAEHIMDEAPDLVVYAFGLNESGNVDAFRTSRVGFEKYAATWTKVPDIAYVTSILPALHQGESWAASSVQLGTQEIADEVRHNALKLRRGLIDANALFRFLRDGVRPEISEYTHEHGTRYLGTPGFWSNFDNAVSISGNSWLFSSPSSVRRNVNARDIDCYVNYVCVDANAVLRFAYRQRSDDALSGYTFQYWAESGLCELYYKGTELKSTSTAILAVETSLDFQFRAVGPRHEVWLGGVKVIDVMDYQCFYSGPIRMGFEIGHGRIRQDILRLAYRQVSPIGPSANAEKYLIGATPYGDTFTNPDSIGGNAINHPSTLGSQATYIMAVARYAKSLADSVYG